MVGVLKVGEAQKEYANGNNIFYRLEKKFDNFYDVYEFYTASNGNMNIRHHEEPFNTDEKRYLGYIYKDYRLGKGDKAKEIGNKKYKELKNKGYKFMGVYKSDICGYAKRIK